MLRSILTTIVLGMTFGLSAFGQSFDDLNTIDRHIAAFRYEEAIADLTARPDSNRFEIRSRKASAHNFLGMDYLSEGSRDEAEGQFRKGLVDAQQLIETYEDEAESHFQYAALRGNLALFRGGRGKVRLGRDVEQFSKSAIRLDSTHVAAHIVLGVFYREAASLNWIERTAARAFFGGLPGATLDQSLEVLHRAVRLDPNSAFARFEKAGTLLALGRENEARAELEMLLKLTPENSQDGRNQLAARQILSRIGTK